jgi:hypothetical protein
MGNFAMGKITVMDKEIATFTKRIVLAVAQIVLFKFNTNKCIYISKSSSN